MRSFNQVVFDDVVAASSSVTAITDPKWNDLLGSADALSLHAVVDNVSGTVTSLSVQIWHAADERNFVKKNTAAEISLVVPAANTTNVYVGSDGGGIPTHGYVQLQITLVGTNVSMHVKIYAVGR